MSDSGARCGECRFWARSRESSQDGECLPAGGNMSIGSGAQPLMETRLDESKTRGVHVFDDSPVAILTTHWDFGCVHADPRGDLDAPKLPGFIAQQSASCGSRECQWEAHRPGEQTYRCPESKTLIWPACPECPFRQLESFRSLVVSEDGEIIAANEQEYLRKHLDDALESANAAMREVMTIKQALDAVDGRTQGRINGNDR